MKYWQKTYQTFEELSTWKKYLRSSFLCKKSHSLTTTKEITPDKSLTSELTPPSVDLNIRTTPRIIKNKKRILDKTPLFQDSFIDLITP